MSDDPFENKNVADSHPEVFNRLRERWQAHATKNSIREQYGSQDQERGFGYDRGETQLHLVDSMPVMMSENVPVDCGLRLKFDAPLDFKGTNGKKIRLLRYGSSDILWEADLDESHLAQGEKTVVFDDFPELEPDEHYTITWDRGFANLVRNGKPVPVAPVNETSIAFRFETVK